MLTVVQTLRLQERRVIDYLPSRLFARDSRRPNYCLQAERLRNFFMLGIATFVQHLCLYPLKIEFGFAIEIPAKGSMIMVDRRPGQSENIIHFFPQLTAGPLLCTSPARIARALSRLWSLLRLAK
jgi:hypothetical protein